MTLPDKATIETYGGRKANYGPVADPQTDVDADDHNELVTDVAGLTLVGTRALASFVGHATTPTAPPGFEHTAVWGEQMGVKPAVSKVGGGGSGEYNLTWPEKVTDALGTQRSVNFRGAKAWAEGATPLHAQAEVIAPNVVRVRVWNFGGFLTDGVSVTFRVEAF